VANRDSDNVTIIDGTDNSTVTVSAGNSPFAICVNPNTNKIYVANQSSNNVTVIDGLSNLTTTVASGESPWAICVNPNTNKIYASNINGNDVTVIEEVAIYPSPLASSITPLTDNETTDKFPSFTGTSVNSRTPNNSNIMKVLYQFETTQGEWEEATVTSGGGTSNVSWDAAALDSLVIGFHSLYVVALDSTSGTINMTENFTGGITPYYFLVRTPGSGITLDDNPENQRLILSVVNPFINPAIITYTIPEGTVSQQVNLNVYNISGALVKKLVDQECVPGIHNATWNGTNEEGINVPGGVYIYNLEMGDMKASSKGIVVR